MKLRSNQKPQPSKTEDWGTRKTQIQLHGHLLQKLWDMNDDQNFTIVLRVTVTWLVIMAGPPLKRCQVEYCSM